MLKEKGLRQKKPERIKLSLHLGERAIEKLGPAIVGPDEGDIKLELARLNKDVITGSESAHLPNVTVQRAPVLLSVSPSGPPCAVCT